MTSTPVLLLSSESDDLSYLQPAFEAAVARLCPGLRIVLSPPADGMAGVDPADVVAMAAWFAPVGLPARLPRLRLMASIGAGVEHVLRDASLPAGLPVTRIVDAEQARGMAEYVLWAALHFHRGLDQALHQQASGIWRMPPQRPAAQTRVGVMGLGAMGAEVARVLAAHGFAVSGWSRSPRLLPGVACFHGAGQMSAFLSDLDIVVCLLPLTEETRGLCNAAWFAQLKPGAAFVNAGRGEHVVLPDLLDALERGQVRGAVLDVFEHEPLPADHPLWHTPRLLVTPHMASSASPDTIAQQIVADTARVLAGEAPLNAIDRQRGY